MKGTGDVSWALVFFLLWLGSINVAWGQEVSPSQCQDEMRQGIGVCMAIAMGQPPSAACCARIRVTHAECVCQLVTPEVAVMIDVDWAKKLVEGCRRKILPNSSVEAPLFHERSTNTLRSASAGFGIKATVEHRER